MSIMRIEINRRIRDDGLVWFGGAWRSLASIEKNRICDRENKRGKGHPTRIKLRQQVFDILGEVCYECGMRDARCLHIDHKNGGGHQHRKNSASPTAYYKYILAHIDDFQILCANCNWIKRYINGEHR